MLPTVHAARAGVVNLLHTSVFMTAGAVTVVVEHAEKPVGFGFVLDDGVVDGVGSPREFVASVGALASIAREFRIIGSVGLIVKCGLIEGFTAM